MSARGRAARDGLQPPTRADAASVVAWVLLLLLLVACGCVAAVALRFLWELFRFALNAVVSLFVVMNAALP